MESSVRILMLEDSPLDAELATAVLDKAGIEYEWRRVQDQRSYLAELAERCPDLILSDFNLPGFSGNLALDLARERCPDVPFLFVSGAMGEEVAIESLKRGATDYVLKEKLDRLPPAVRRALGEARERLERRQAEEALERKARELTVLNGDLQQFAYAASHDLQEPLRTISLFSKLLATRYSGKLDKQADEYLGFIEAAARHMSALLEDLLIYARIPAQERTYETVDCNALVDDTIKLFQATIAQTGATIEHDDLPLISSNSSQLGLVFQNLISNALKYRSIQAPVVHIQCRETDGKWIFSVRDNGIGFDQRYSEQVFGLFKRLNNRDFPGTGLGLAISKRVIESVGGRIWAESGLGKGSTFYFSVPVQDVTPPSGADVLISSVPEEHRP